MSSTREKDIKRYKNCGVLNGVKCPADRFESYPKRVYRDSRFDILNFLASRNERCPRARGHSLRGDDRLVFDE